MTFILGVNQIVLTSFDRSCRFVGKLLLEYKTRPHTFNEKLNDSISELSISCRKFLHQICPCKLDNRSQVLTTKRLNGHSSSAVHFIIIVIIFVFKFF